MLLQALCIISYPLVNSNWSYSPETPNLGQIWRFLEPCDLVIWRMTMNKANLRDLITATGLVILLIGDLKLEIHIVESPSMVNPQWHIWYWGSKWNLDTVCWSAVGCEWCTTSVYFGITYVCFIPSRLPVFTVEPQDLLEDFSFLSKVSFEVHIQNLQKISCWFKIWMGFVGPIVIKLWTSFIWCFL